MLACPFCGAAESDRFEIEGERFIVFSCMFTPNFSPELSDTEIAERLSRDYGPQGSAYFRAMCDRLHLVVKTRPELGAPTEADAQPP